jgi:diguanylate cyclase (GGDEF)-like protein
MISIKKFLERNVEELYRAVLNAYLAVLHAIGDRAGDVKELMLILASTADLTMERDQRYSRQFQEFTGRLQAMVDLNDLAMLRSSLVRSAIDLKACTEAMVEESRTLAARLRQDVNAYKTRLEDAERLAVLDPLTGLDNRRRVESAIEHRIGQKQAFSILLLDLNDFKQLNDTCGHLAGDEILKQFSSELKAGFRATDVVGRWGGDEFIVILDAGLGEATAHIDRISRWVFGDYSIRVAGARRKVGVSAAIGAAEWQAGESSRMLLERADTDMYRHKHARTNAGNSGP